MVSTGAQSHKTGFLEVPKIVDLASCEYKDAITSTLIERLEKKQRSQPAPVMQTPLPCHWVLP